MKLVIVGGGGFRVPLVYRALSTGQFAGLIDQVVLHDAEPTRLDAIARVLNTMPLPAGSSRPHLETETRLEAALVGADVVFAAIRSGGAAGRVIDERVALAEGLLGQETVGAGGISYALRSVPQMLAVAESMRRVCPDAWLINFTNPAGMVTRAVQGVLGDTAIGICDSASGLVSRAAHAAGVPLKEGSLAGVDYVGLNHLGWLRGLTFDGADRLPELLADPQRLASFEEGRVFGPDLPQLLRAIPNEYLFYYYFHREAVRSLAGSAETRGAFLHRQQEGLYTELLTTPEPFAVWEGARLAREEGYLAEARPDAAVRDEADLAGGGYERIALAAMRALLTGQTTELIVNVRNNGALPSLAADAVVEVPARLDRTGATPLPANPLAPHQLGLMAQVLAVEEAVVQAAVHADRDAALRAFLLHPLIDSAHAATRLLRGYEREFPDLAAFWK
ncbi:MULTISPECIES: 6-phospho-beta-glucosidase [unclassified Arthrobacter]|uniref:family 4 glycosyl hydrolase n=1 Tax=unclassified Arthrobacter TaxID=235627 RepID=UPI001493131E|nr:MULTISPECIES: 6-phospho-beta-glucosidase [unclassified Arthrobacter]MBE0008830.1 6-phospho-beta-glucosidase [Arthrobacter sp. AET 35A]NOJ62690.1 6-phospho-beta-glucosidase [Arthrobacter sp. 147(2020)]